MANGEYDRVVWHGEPITRRQRQALISTEQVIRDKYRGFEFLVPQGSWQPQTTYSGTSHTRAAVVDLQYSGMGYRTRAEQEKYRFVLRCVRDNGRQAAFGRGPWNKQIDGSGAMPLHLHTVDLDTTGAAESAIWQVGQYRLGCDGLYAGEKDKFPFHPSPIKKWVFR